jgi:hypothetical protein
MSRRWKSTGIVVAMLATLACAAAIYAAWGLQQVDPRYAEALELDPAQAASDAQKLEERVAKLNADASQGSWNATFTEDEVNGWLASVLREKLPKLLPPEVQDPRVQLKEGRVFVAYRYAGKLTTVITLETEPRIERDGLIGIRLVSAYAGFFPVANSLVVKEVDELAATLQWPVEWREQPDKLELFIPMRDLFSTDSQDRELAELAVHDGKVELGGNAEQRDETDAVAAAGPVGDSSAATN